MTPHYVDPNAVMVRQGEHDHPAIPLADMVRQLAYRRPRIQNWTARTASRLAFGLGIGGLCPQENCGTASILDGTWGQAADLLNTRVEQDKFAAVWALAALTRNQPITPEWSQG